MGDVWEARSERFESLGVSRHQHPGRTASLGCIDDRLVNVGRRLVDACSLRLHLCSRFRSLSRFAQ